MEPAIFFDRDGTLTKNPGVTLKKTDLKLQKGALALIRLINSLGLPVIVVTNQGSVARGHISLRGVQALHRHLQDVLKRNGAMVDAFYFCPHHLTEGVSKTYQVVCDCRKPKPGMLKKAARDLGIDLKRSLMVGDTTLDIAAGKRAGTKTVLIRTGHAGLDKTINVKPDYYVKDLSGLSRLVKKLYKKARG